MRIIILVGVLVLVALSTPSAAAQFEAEGTVPPMGAGDPVRIAVIGDYGDNSSEERAVADLVHGWQPDAIATTGDNNYPNGDVDTIDGAIGKYYHDYIYPYHGSYGVGSTTNRFFPTLGNHDWYTTEGIPPLPQPYLDYFGLPGEPAEERYYDVLLGPVHLFMLDSDPNEPDGNLSTSVQADWPRDSLASSNAPWKLVCLHHAPFSSGLVHGPTVAMQWPFRKWGATAVLAGHDHTYERIIRDGIPYFVNGIGGAHIYEIGPPVAGSEAQFNDRHGAMLIEATPITITFQLIDRDGVEQDRYTMDTAIPLTGPTPLTPFHIVEQKVGQSSDDAEEFRSTQEMYLTSSDLEMSVDLRGPTDQLIGLRFTGIQVPKAAVITRAYIEFTVDVPAEVDTTLGIFGQAAVDAPTFSMTPGDISLRPRTVAGIMWERLPDRYVAGATQRTPDLAPIVQEIVDQEGWNPGQAMAFIVDGYGQRPAVAYDGDPALAPLLHIEYAGPGDHTGYLPLVKRP